MKFRTNQQRNQSRAKRRTQYERLEERRMLSSNLPDVDGQIDLTREFISNTATTEYLLQDRSELNFVEVKHGLASTTTRFQQTVDGIPVHGAIITINQGADGRLQQIHHSLAFNTAETTFPEPLENVPFSVSSAEAAAIEHANVESTFAPMRGGLAWYVDAAGDIHQVWDIMVFSGINPVGDFLTIVDVSNNEVIHQENRAAFATGTGDTFVPNPWQTQGNGTGLVDDNDNNSPELEAQLITVELERLDDGTGLLIGEWVDVATLNSPDLDDVDADEPSRIYQYTRDDPRFEQVVVYHTVDQLNEYFHQLGFDDDSGTPNGIRDFPTLANAHWFDQDQSFYSTGDDAIHMGDGGVDDGEDADIIAHEYGHAIQFNQNAAWGGGEMGAMGEGFGDWLAAAFYMNDGDAAFQAAHAAAVGEWDALSYSSDDPPNLRRVDGNKRYPDDLGFGVHADGEIWSRALWDLTANVGRDASMQLVLEQHFMLAASASMTTAANTLLMANTNMFNDNNLAAVRHPFVERGILAPETIISLDDTLYDAGDTITITVSDLNPGPNPVAILTTVDGDQEIVPLTATSTGLLTGTIGTNDTGVFANDGVIGVQAALTDLTAQYFSLSGVATDTAQIEAEVEIIEGTDGNDIIVVTIGEQFTTIDVNGTEFPIDRSVSSATFFDAKAGYDQITIFDGPGNDSASINQGTVEITGDFTFSGSNVEWVNIVSGGGLDVANIFGSNFDDVFTTDTNDSILTGQDFRYGTTGYDQVNAYGLGGTNTATFTDTAGNDRLSATSVFAKLTSGGKFVNARDFSDVTVRAVNGGFDVGVLNGGDQADFAYATPEFTRLTTDGVQLTAVGFERTNTKGRGGDDRATLVGSEFDDRLNARLRNSYLFGEGFFNQVVDFPVVNAIGGGGRDEAILIDSPGNDTLFATPTETTLFNDQHRARATGFYQVTALGSAGFDNATFVGTTGNDRYVARPDSAFMYGDDYLYYAVAFNRVTAKGLGGVDRALLIGSPEDNRFFGSKSESYLFGSTFFNSAEGFRFLSLRFNNDALYIGTFVDSDGDDTLFARGSMLSFYGDDYLIDAQGLDIVNAKSENGGLDQAFANLAEFDVNLLGDWV
ncbi:MAG: M4 family metallopeptidase [Planctomycetota bacterium]